MHDDDKIVETQDSRATFAPKTQSALASTIASTTIKAHVNQNQNQNQILSHQHLHFQQQQQHHHHHHQQQQRESRANSTSSTQSSILSSLDDSDDLSADSQFDLRALSASFCNNNKNNNNNNNNNNHNNNNNYLCKQRLFVARRKLRNLLAMTKRTPIPLLASIATMILVMTLLLLSNSTKFGRGFGSTGVGVVSGGGNDGDVSLAAAESLTKVSDAVSEGVDEASSAGAMPRVKLHKRRLALDAQLNSDRQHNQQQIQTSNLHLGRHARRMRGDAALEREREQVLELLIKQATINQQQQQQQQQPTTSVNDDESLLVSAASGQQLPAADALVHEATPLELGDSSTADVQASASSAVSSPDGALGVSGAAEDASLFLDQASLQPLQQQLSDEPALSAESRALSSSNHRHTSNLNQHQHAHQSLNTNNININNQQQQQQKLLQQLQQQQHQRHQHQQQPDEAHDDSLILYQQLMQQQQQHQQQQQQHHNQQQQQHSNNHNNNNNYNHKNGHERRFDVAQIHCNTTEDGFERFACPSADNLGRFRCIEDRFFCDGYFDCPNHEDEDRHWCMFYKLTISHIDILTSSLLSWSTDERRHRNNNMMLFNHQQRAND